MKSYNEKPIVIFTTFWEAEILLKKRYLLVPLKNKESVYRIFLYTNPNNLNNYSIHSIALQNPPDNKIPLLARENISRLSFFCPTYNMLHRYKKNRDWEKYKNEFIDLIKDRKEDIKKWLSSLKSQHVYILCCWENTKTGANCHRRIIYDIFSKSKKIRDNILGVYRSGDNVYDDSMLIDDSTERRNDINDVNSVDDLNITIDNINNISPYLRSRTTNVDRSDFFRQVMSAYQAPQDNLSRNQRQFQSVHTPSVIRRVNR